MYKQFRKKNCNCLVLKELSKLGISNRGVKTRLCGDIGPKWEYSDGSVADYYAVIRYPMKGDGEDRGKVATCEITVQEIGVILSKKEKNLLVGKKAKIDYTITPETATDKTVTWKSSDEAIATVSKEGIITALKEGITDITATIEKESKQQ